MRDDLSGEPPLPPMDDPMLVSVVARRCFTGSCCRSHALEAVLFGALMPLALAGYWFADAHADYAAYGGRWLKARCHLHALHIESSQVYHHGKWQDAKDVVYQQGLVYRLEPAWNATVALLEPHPDDTWSYDTWEAVAHSSVLEYERPRCEGQVLQSLAETRLGCEPLSDWVPQLSFNRSHPYDCYVHRDRSQSVYLDVEEPTTFYSDITLLLLCSAVSLLSCCCLLRAHAHRVAAALSGAPASAPASARAAGPGAAEAGAASAERTMQRIRRSAPARVVGTRRPSRAGEVAGRSTEMV